MEGRASYRSVASMSAATVAATTVTPQQQVAAAGPSVVPRHQTATETFGQPSVVGPAHVQLGIARGSQNVEVPAAPAAKRPRKERAANWSTDEVYALIDAKRSQFMQESGTVDPRHLMVPDAGKWLRISAAIAHSGVSTELRDGPACKSKWNLIIPDYKRIIDFLSRSGTNELSYWTLSPQEKKAEGLPKTFPEGIFARLHSWYRSRPAVTLPHSRDLLSGEDSNYRTPVADSSGPAMDEFMDDLEDDMVAPTAAMAESDDVSNSTQSCMPSVQRDGVQVQGIGTPSSPVVSPSAARKGSLPPGITPYFLSSSDTAHATYRRLSSSTGVRRKSVSGHSLIAEATRASGDAMTYQMKEMGDASREIERSKIEVQLKLFSEQMEYQRERDRRLHETARQANDNAKLSIEKQGEVVTYLAQLASVLSFGLERRQPSSTANEDVPHSSSLHGQQQPAPMPTSTQGYVPKKSTDSAGPSNV